MYISMCLSYCYYHQLGALYIFVHQALYYGHSMLAIHHTHIMSPKPINCCFVTFVYL